MIKKLKDDFGNIVEFGSQEEVLEFLDKNTKEISDKLPKAKRDLKSKSVDSLRKAYFDQDLVLVLGAGASIDYGTPSWNSLLQKLLMLTIQGRKDIAIVLSKLFTNIFSPASVITGRYLQNHFSNGGDELTFETKVRTILYESADKKSDSPTMDAIAKFCIAPGKTPNLDSIITYNYDDLLESYLTKLDLDIPFRSIYGNGMAAKNGELPIYHVHGFLPEEGDLTKDNLITLGDGIYHQQYTDIYSWNNIAQINKFRDKTCLFIGTSLNDPNTRRLLDIARIQKGSAGHFHFILKREYKEAEIEKELNDLLRKDKSLRNEKSEVELKPCSRVGKKMARSSHCRSCAIASTYAPSTAAP